jgi:dTDP-glucose 4,6-dehydratase
MKTIVVTGGAGFIGSAFVRYQLRTHPDVSIINFDKLTYAGNLDNVKGCDPERHRFVQGDIADKDAIRSVMEGCDAIVNFAADTHVDRSIMGASDFIATNVTGVYNICEAARDLGTKRVLLVSTDEVYGSIRTGSFQETDPPGPRNPYSASKAGGELIALAHHETFGTPVTITRGSNTYGPYQYPEKVMPLFITNLLEGKQVPLYQGGEHNVRDWCGYGFASWGSGTDLQCCGGQRAGEHRADPQAARSLGERGRLYSACQRSPRS